VSADLRAAPRPPVLPLDQKRAAMHLRGLLRTAEGPPIPSHRGSSRRVALRILYSAATLAVLGVAVLKTNEYLEAAAKIKKADLASWDKAAQVLLENETMPDTGGQGRPARREPLLRSPAQILELAQNFLEHPTGPEWQELSAAQSEEIRIIARTYVDGLTALNRVPPLEAILYCRSMVSFSANSLATELSNRLLALTETAAAFQKFQQTWDGTPADAPRDHVARIVRLANLRIAVMQAEAALLGYLVENPRDWALPRQGEIRLPYFPKKPMQQRLSELLETESRGSKLLLQELSQLVGPTLSRQLKSLR
jgi:hypothetical protein